MVVSLIPFCFVGWVCDLRCGTLIMAASAAAVACRERPRAERRLTERVAGQRIDTNQGRRWSLALCPDEIGSNTMPLDLIWLVAVVTAFAIFAGTLFWADRRTRKLNK